MTVWYFTVAGVVLVCMLLFWALGRIGFPPRGYDSAFDHFLFCLIAALAWPVFAYYFARDLLDEVRYLLNERRSS